MPRLSVRAGALLLGLLPGSFLFAAPPAAPAPERPDPVAVDRATRRAVAYLLSVQEADGSWRDVDLPHYRGATALVVHALLRAGLSPEHPAIRAARAWFLRQPLHRTYDVAVTLQALADLGDAAPRDLAEALAEQLVETMGNGSKGVGGMWGYPFAHSGTSDLGYTDLSNTQYALMGLRAARRLGVRVRRSVFERAAETVLGRQGDYGAFAYRPGHAPTGSMTVAGMTVLLVAAEAERSRRGDSAFARRLERAVGRSEQWLRAHFSVERNPVEAGGDAGGPSRWDYYYLYGVERVGSLLGRDRLAGHEWYAEGAASLLRRQEREGGFSTPWGERTVNTAFALLFLVRATAETGVRPVPSRVVTDGEDGPFTVVVDGSCPLVLFVVAVGDAVRERLDAGESVRELVWYVDGSEAARVVPSDGRDLGRERFTARVPCPRNGRLQVEAVMRFRDASGRDAGEERVGPLAVEVDGAEETLHRLAVRDAGRDLVVERRVRVEASSSRSGAYRPEFAVDDRCASAWLCAEDDEKPRLKIQLRRAAQASVLSLVVAHGPIGEGRSLAHPRIVEVRFDGGRPRRLLLFDAPRVKQRFSFPPHKVRTIELRILKTQPGLGFRRSCGFAEVELFAPGGEEERDPLVRAEERRPLLPVGDGPPKGRFVFEDPGPGFAKPDFDDGRWQSGVIDFEGEVPRSRRRELTQWPTRELFVRARVEVDDPDAGPVVVEVRVDDTAEVFWNGEPVGRVERWTKGAFQPFLVPTGWLRRGTNVLAVRARDLGGARRLLLRATQVVLETAPSSR